MSLFDFLSACNHAHSASESIPEAIDSVYDNERHPFTTAYNVGEAANDVRHVGAYGVGLLGRARKRINKIKQDYKSYF